RPSAMCLVSPVAGSRCPSAPCPCAVYHTPPSSAGATSCGRVPGGTGNDSTSYSRGVLLVTAGGVGEAVALSVAVSVAVGDVGVEVASTDEVAVGVGVGEASSSAV